MNEVNNLLNRLGELEDAPLVWINKKVYDMAAEIERLKKENKELDKICAKKSRYIDKKDLKINELLYRIDQAKEELSESDLGYHIIDEDLGYKIEKRIKNALDGIENDEESDF